MLASWDLVFRSGSKLQITCRDVEVHVSEQLAFLTCTEVVNAPSARGRHVRA